MGKMGLMGTIEKMDNSGCLFSPFHLVKCVLWVPDWLLGPKQLRLVRSAGVAFRCILHIQGVPFTPFIFISSGIFLGFTSISSLVACLHQANCGRP